MCNVAYSVVSIYAPSSFTIKKNHKSLKNLLCFLKTMAHNFGRENKLNNSEIWSWLIGLGPIRLS